MLEAKVIFVFSIMIRVRLRGRVLGSISFMSLYRLE